MIQHRDIGFIAKVTSIEFHSPLDLMRRAAAGGPLHIRFLIKDVVDTLEGGGQLHHHTRQPGSYTPTARTAYPHMRQTVSAVPPTYGLPEHPDHRKDDEKVPTRQQKGTKGIKGRPEQFIAALQLHQPLGILPETGGFPLFLAEGFHHPDPEMTSLQPAVDFYR